MPLFLFHSLSWLSDWDSGLGKKASTISSSNGYFVCEILTSMHSA